MKSQRKSDGRVKTADQPFCFYAASDLVRICNQDANNLAELGEALEQCSDASIFYHTFQSLGRHHFLTERFRATSRSGCLRPAIALSSRSVWPVWTSASTCPLSSCALICGGWSPSIVRRSRSSQRSRRLNLSTSARASRSLCRSAGKRGR